MNYIWYDGEEASQGEQTSQGGQVSVSGIPDDFDFGTVLPTDLKDNASLAKFAGHKGKAWAENVARSLVSAQGMIGADPNELVRVPVDPKNITPEDRAKVMDRLGYPKDSKAYELKAPEKGAPPGLEPDGPLGKWFSEAAFKHGVFPAAAQSLYNEFVEQNRAAVAQQQNMFAAMDKANIESLQKEFGKAFDGEIKAAQFGAAKLGGNEFVQRIGDFGLGTDPVFVKAMAKYGRAMSESTGGGDKGDAFSSGRSPAVAHAEATGLLRQAMEIMDKDPGKARELNQRAQEIFASAV